MQNLLKITQIADRFMANTTQSLPEHFAVDIAISLGNYHSTIYPLDLDAMLTTEDLYSFKHDVIGIMNDDKFFYPRFALRSDYPVDDREAFAKCY
jgi:hypothetical protein